VLVTDLSYRYSLQACDIIIVFKKSNIFRRGINKIFGSTFCHYNTSSIFLFLFDDLCADTTPAGVRNRTLFSYDRAITTIIVARYIDLEQHQKNTIIEAALHRATEKHSFIAKNIKNNCYPCTKFITQCFLAAGIFLFPGKGVEEITIDDFMECALLDKILINDCKQII
jgi:hypothetical protein